MIDIAYCISGRGLGFRAVAKACHDGLIDARISKVICDRPSSVLPWARDRGLDAELVNFADFNERHAFDKAVETCLSNANPEFIFLTYNRLLPKSTIDLFNGNIINLHMALLPLFPGFGSIKAAFASGMKVGGVTIHFVTPKMDDGPIISQAVVRIDHSKGLEYFGFELFKASVPLQLQVVRDASNGVVSFSDKVNVSTREREYGSGLFFPSVDEDLLDFSQAYLDVLTRNMDG